MCFFLPCGSAGWRSSCTSRFPSSWTSSFSGTSADCWPPSRHWKGVALDGNNSKEGMIKRKGSQEEKTPRSASPQRSRSSKLRYASKEERASLDTMEYSSYLSLPIAYIRLYIHLHTYMHATCIRSYTLSSTGITYTDSLGQRLYRNGEVYARPSKIPMHAWRRGSLSLSTDTLRKQKSCGSSSPALRL